MTRKYNVYAEFIAHCRIRRLHEKALVASCMVTRTVNIVVHHKHAPFCVGICDNGFFYKVILVKHIILS